MDHETRHKANAVSKEISEEKGRLESLNNVLRKINEAPENKNHCQILIYNEKALIDFEVLEVAYTLQEKRVQDRIDKLSKEFAEL